MKVKKTVDQEGRLIGYSFTCPGCKDRHVLPVRPLPQGVSESPDAGMAHWHFNGDLEKPTFSPSISVVCGHYAGQSKSECACEYNRLHPEEADDFTCYICHSFVRNGAIEFLNDCTHVLAGQKMELPDL